MHNLEFPDEDLGSVSVVPRPGYLGSHTSGLVLEGYKEKHLKRRHASTCSGHCLLTTIGSPGG